MSIYGLGEHIPVMSESPSYCPAKTEKKDKEELKKQDSFSKAEENTETDNTKQIYKKDTALIEQLKNDTAKRKQQLMDLVEQSLSKQGKTYKKLCDMFKAIQTGELPVDPAEVEQAKADVAEDGYWSVKQTSNRLVSFAKALSGGDPSKADIMINAVEKGFQQATKAWGDDLPDICKETLQATKEKLNEWKNELHPEKGVEEEQ